MHIVIIPEDTRFDDLKKTVEQRMKKHSRKIGYYEIGGPDHELMNDYGIPRPPMALEPGFRVEELANTDTSNERLLWAKSLCALKDFPIDKELPDVWVDLEGLWQSEKNHQKEFMKDLLS